MILKIKNDIKNDHMYFGIYWDDHVTPPLIYKDDELYQLIFYHQATFAFLILLCFYLNKLLDLICSQVKSKISLYFSFSEVPSMCSWGIHWIIK